MPAGTVLVAGMLHLARGLSIDSALIQMSLPDAQLLAESCHDIAGGAVDKQFFPCAVYNGAPDHMCSRSDLDDTDFSATVMCCGCGGGSPPTPAPTSTPTASPTVAPTESPTAAPTESPTAAPTERPTAPRSGNMADLGAPAPTFAPTSAAVVTSLSVAVRAGATEIQVASEDGFVVGDTITISDRSNSETGTIVRFGSIILDQPLTNDYAAGATITRESTQASTPAPGVPCACLADECFKAYDLDEDGQLSARECQMQKTLGMDNCTAWDSNRDRYLDRAEWAPIFEQHSDWLCPTLEPPPTVCCPMGQYIESAGKCETCSSGETRRRHLGAFQCSQCPTGKFDAGDYDDCIGGIYLLSDARAGTTTFLVSSALDLVVDQVITITDMPEAVECDGHPLIGFESKTITSIDEVWDSNGLVRTQITVDSGFSFSFTKYSSIRVGCTVTDGSSYSLAYTDGVCGCGAVSCTTYEACDMRLNNGTGGCGPLGPFPNHPTPAPTVGAKGDPHLVNLAGEHFDINHGGEFTLLRIPQSTQMPAEIQLQATIQPEFGKPCTTYITQVELTGSWLGGATLQARSYLRSHSDGEADARLGVRLASDTAGASQWQGIENFTSGEQVLSQPDQEVEVTLSKNQWFPRKRSDDGVPAVAGMFTLAFRNKKSTEASKVIIRQDLPDQEHLNLAVRRISALGRADVGGLLGFDAHPDWLETVSGECHHHRATEKYRIESQDDRDDDYLYTKPKWMQKWDRIRRERREKAESGAKDNEAAASLMCKCSSDWNPGADRYAEGVYVEEQIALMAEATWY